MRTSILQRSSTIAQIVTDGIRRKYYRLSRGGVWYGGIATADCCGCNLKCVFCWSNFPRDNPDKCGKFYTPEEVFNALISCAKRYGYKQLRVSGNEPTIAIEHLLRLLSLIDKTDYKFILETNGTLIDKEYAKDLSQFKNLSVRVSIKGTTPEEFSRLTGLEQIGFQLQLNALENLLAYNVDCWPCVVISFSPEENISSIKKTLSSISNKLIESLETEIIFLLPHIVKRLNEAGLKPFLYEDMEFAKTKECM